LLPRAVEVSIATRQAVYDCIYLALAEQEQCEMVSADDQFVRKMRPAFPFLIRLADLP
jgi:predicted nucleic acid-binding protein